MRFSLVLITALPLALAAGCVQSHRDYGYTPSATVVAPTSPSTAVRVYPDRSVPRVATAPGEADDLTIANSIRDILAVDSAHVYGRVDIAVNSGAATLRGSVPTEHDRLQLESEIAALPGVTSVNNQLVVELR